jgi:hypothetical protein
MASIEIQGDNLIVHIHGWDKLLALRSTLTIPLAHVTGITARPADARYDEMRGLRVAGGYWPGSFAAGYFWVTGGAFGGHQEALEKLDLARKRLEHPAADPGEHYAKAVGHIDEAVAEVRLGLEAAKVPDAVKYLAFYDVHDPEKSVGLDVEHEKLRRLVIQLDEETPDAAAARIGAAIAARKK